MAAPDLRTKEDRRISGETVDYLFLILILLLLGVGLTMLFTVLISFAMRPRLVGVKMAESLKSVE